MSEIISRQKNTPANMNSGAVAIEQERAIAEAQGQIIVAKKCPRDVNAVHSELTLACQQLSLASVAFYSVPNRGSGPSIRLAEEVARCWGNIEWGHRELSRIETKWMDVGRSEIEVYAWDKQTNTRSIRQLTILHSIETKSGTKILRDSTDVDNLVANKAAKQMRGRLLAILPKWLTESAKEECQKTLTKGNGAEPLIVRARKMVTAFSSFGVTLEMIEQKLNHSLESISTDELIEFMGIYNSLKEGFKASDFFEQKEKESVGLAGSIENALAKAEPAKNEPIKNEPAKLDPIKIEPVKTESKPKKKTDPVAIVESAPEPEPVRVSAPVLPVDPVEDEFQDEPEDEDLF